MLLGAVAVLSFTASVAVANMFDGMWTDGGHTGYRGAKAQIDNYVPRYSNDGFSCAWPMVVNSSYYPAAFAQIGWMRGNNTAGTVKYFWEYEDTTGIHNYIQQLSAVPSPGDWETHHTYMVQFVTDNAIEMSIDGVVKVYENNYNPSVWWTPDEVQYVAEVIDNGDQIAGDGTDTSYPYSGTYHHVAFQNPAEYSTGNWHIVSPTADRCHISGALQHAHQYHSIADQVFKTWDDRWSSED